MIEAAAVFLLSLMLGGYLLAFLATGDHCDHCLRGTPHKKCTNDKYVNRHEKDNNDDFMR